MKYKSRSEHALGKLSGRALTDLFRQALTLLPMVVLFYWSKDIVYFQISILTSATTLASAVFSLGLNISSLMPKNRILVREIQKFNLFTLPFAFFSAVLLLVLLGKVNFLGEASVLIFLLGEIIYTLCISLIARHSINASDSYLSALANFLSPLFRSASFCLLLTVETRNIAVVFHCLSQISILVLGLYKIKPFQRHKPNQASFRSLFQESKQIWWSSLLVTAIDNLTIFVLAISLEVHTASLMMVSLRVFGVVGMPIQSLAAARLSGWVKSGKEELLLAIRVGALAALFGFVSLLTLDLLINKRLTELSWLAAGLAPIAPFRSMSTFLGNFLLTNGFANLRTRVLAIVSVLLITFFGTQQHFPLIGKTPAVYSIAIVAGEAFVFIGLYWLTSKKAEII